MIQTYEDALANDWHVERISAENGSKKFQLVRVIPSDKVMFAIRVESICKMTADNNIKAGITILFEKHGNSFLVNQYTRQRIVIIVVPANRGT